MIVKVVVKHSQEASWDDSKEFYSCSTSDPTKEIDPLNVSAITEGNVEFADKIGLWQSWNSFSDIVSKLQLSNEEVSVDISLVSFPQFAANPAPMMINQGLAATMFLQSVVKFIPCLRDDMSGVWIRVD